MSTINLVSVWSISEKSLKLNTKIVLVSVIQVLGETCADDPNLKGYNLACFQLIIFQKLCLKTPS